MKKLIVMLSIFSVLLVGCGSTTNEDDVVTIFNLKVEMDPALKNLAAAYTTETGTQVEVKSVGGGADYGAALKSEFESGNAPDIFVVAGAGDVAIWEDVLYDMSGEEWTNLTDDEFMSESAQTVGYPISIEGYGLVCDNKKLEDAGVNYKEVKTYEDLVMAFEKISATGIDPVSYTTKETWVTGNHTINLLFAGSTEEQFNDYMTGNGETLSYEGYAEMVKLLMDNSYGDLSTIDYDTQVSNFTNGKTACIFQGNWVIPNIEANGMSTDDLVLLPVSYNDATAGKFPVGVPSYFVVNKDGDVEEATDFINYMATSEAGKTFYTEANMIPAVEMDVMLEDTVSQQIMAANNSGQALEWRFTNLPDGFGMNVYGPIFDQYYKTKDEEEFIQQLKDTSTKIE